MKTYSLPHAPRWFGLILTPLLFGAIPAWPGDIGFYSVQKGQLFVQSSSSAPALAPQKPFVFEASTEWSGQGQINSVDITRPGGGQTHVSGDGFAFYVRDAFSTQSEMDSIYRSGTYRFDFDSENDLFTFATVGLTGDTYPSTPHVANYAAAQAANPAADFTVQWDAFTGGTTDDIVELYVYDETDTVVYTDAGLDGTARSDTIPASTLAAGKTYRSELIFRKTKAVVFDASGAIGISFYHKTTQFTLTAAGSTVTNPPPTFSNPVRSQTTGQFQFHIDGVAGRSYRIESTADFSSWTPVQTMTAPAGGGIDFAESLGPGPKFYRVALLPP